MFSADEIAMAEDLRICAVMGDTERRDPMGTAAKRALNGVTIQPKCQPMCNKILENCYESGNQTGHFFQVSASETSLNGG